MMMASKSRVCLVAIVASTSMVPLAASATQRMILKANIIYEEPEVEALCYGEVPISALIGIPVASAAEASLSPALVLHSPFDPAGAMGRRVVELAGRHYVDLNEISRGAGIRYRYENDALTANGVLEFDVTLDVTELAAENGVTLEGRAQTVRQAKLAVLALAKNTKDLAPMGLYRLSVRIEGLPDRQGLSGAPLYAQNAYPFSGASPLLAAYEKELIDNRFCSNPQTALYGAPATAGPGKADGVAADHPPGSAAGCAVAGGEAPLAASATVLLLVGLALRRRRRR